MAKTGFVSSSGIQQVFTSGPFSGSVVTSSYASGGILFGPTLNFKQSFISGTVDALAPCYNTYYRRYEDLIACPPNNCAPPVLSNTITMNCASYDYKYGISYSSSSLSASKTIIEYSTTSDFSTNTGSITYNNPTSMILPIDVSSNLPLLPLANTPVYFRAYNSCSVSTTSSYSNIVYTSCTPPPSPTYGDYQINIFNENIFYGVSYTLNNDPTTYSIARLNNSSITLNSATLIISIFLNGYPETYQYIDLITETFGYANSLVSIGAQDDRGGGTSLTQFNPSMSFGSNFTSDQTGIPDLIIYVDRTNLTSGGGRLDILIYNPN